MSVEEFYKELRSSIGAGAAARGDYTEVEFLEYVTKELDDAGNLEGCDLCHYKAQRGVRVDGYWFKESETVIDLFITDFSDRETIESITKTDVDAFLKRLENFFINSAKKHLHDNLEETSQGYSLARDINAKGLKLKKVNLYLITERVLSERIVELESKDLQGYHFTSQVWDIGRLYKLATSRQGKEELVVNFKELFNKKIPCLPAHLDTGNYKSYLLVMPGNILADLYGRFGSRLLEQNVRCFLQARGNVNKGIRNTIINSPEMFFAFNNGITATAREVKFDNNGEGIAIEEITDFQIVNGGQTTASLYHTNLKDKASLDKVFIQIKLSVVISDSAEETVQKISEYANTQNKVNAADFFSNHPFHIRMEEFSRRILAPSKEGSPIDTYWFYERARGQYADAQSKLTKAQQKRFKLQNPKSQMFSKTDLGKFENVWDGNPIYVNRGAQVSFAKYAERIGVMWTKNPEQFNEHYYKTIIARAIIFRSTEKIISDQAWYGGGFRANLVAYTLALFSEIFKELGKSADIQKIWSKQEISEAFKESIASVGEIVHDNIINPPHGILNPSEWCKKEGCWENLRMKLPEFKNALSGTLLNELVSLDSLKEESKTSSNIQKIDDGIAAQKKVIEIEKERWESFFEKVHRSGLCSPRDIDFIKVAKNPAKYPTENQCKVLVQIIEKMEEEGIII